MIKIIYRSLLILITLLLILIVYLSTVGLKTNKFNSQIISQIKLIEPNIQLRLNEVSIKLEPLSFGINAKTIGTDLLYKNKIIKIETIKSKISIKSLLNNKFLFEDISISTKSIAIKDLITLIRLFNNDPKLFIAEKLIKKGYVVANLKLEFDQKGKIKNNYKFNGLVKDGKIDVFKKYDVNKLDLNFEINEKELKFKNIQLLLNKSNIVIPELVALNQNKGYLISGNLITNNTGFNKTEIEKFINEDFLEIDIQEILFDSKNNFNFELSKNFKVKDINIKSDIDIDILKIRNSFQLKNIFPEIKKDFIFKNQKLKVEYENDKLNIIGSGEAFFQNKSDQIEYDIVKKNNEIKFQTKLKIFKNPFQIDLFNYRKNQDSKLTLNFVGNKIINEKMVLNEISLKEKNKIIKFEKLILSKDNKIDDLSNINIDYIDKDGLENNLRLLKKENDYLVFGKSININSLIDELVDSENNNKLKLFNRNFKVIFDIQKIFLNKDNFVNDLKGFLFLNKNEISELNLVSNFSNNQNLKFTIKDNGSEKVTTLYSHKAKPFVDRYKFIKGFEEGDLDFYSIKKNGTTNSILKIDNFKIQEIPVLAKILTLASLQGIADLLTGEGIRFTDFEMKFSNKDELMTIEELYAIGPAISILLEGYIQRKKLISLRGTLVPATTVNRTISSIPLIGDILVGKKIGEGVFGVSFKIKGPPGSLDTTVNPIKTLAPRFITRTLEKIKKN